MLFSRWSRRITIRLRRKWPLDRSRGSTNRKKNRKLPRKKNEKRSTCAVLLPSRPSCQQEKKQKPSASLLGLSLLRAVRLSFSGGSFFLSLDRSLTLTHTQAHKLENFLHKIPNQKMNFPTFHATPRASNPARKWPTVAGIVPARKFAQKTSFFSTASAERSRCVSRCNFFLLLLTVSL